MKHIAVYVRVSSRSQDLRSQIPDLERWVDAFSNGQTVKIKSGVAAGNVYKYIGATPLGRPTPVRSSGRGAPACRCRGSSRCAPPRST